MADIPTADSTASEEMRRTPAQAAPAKVLRSSACPFFRTSGRNLPCASKNVQKHFARQAAGVRVLQRGMVAAHERDAVRRFVLDTVTKWIVARTDGMALAPQVRKVAVPRDVTEAHHHAQPGEQGDLLIEPAGAVRQFIGGGLVAGRCSSANGSDQHIAQLHAVVAAACGGLRGETGLIEHRVEKIP
jgi:hypothetical protein